MGSVVTKIQNINNPEIMCFGWNLNIYRINCTMLAETADCMKIVFYLVRQDCSDITIHICHMVGIV